MPLHVTAAARGSHCRVVCSADRWQEKLERRDQSRGHRGGRRGGVKLRDLLRQLRKLLLLRLAVVAAVRGRGRRILVAGRSLILRRRQQRSVAVGRRRRRDEQHHEQTRTGREAGGHFSERVLVSRRAIRDRARPFDHRVAFLR